MNAGSFFVRLSRKRKGGIHQGEAMMVQHTVSLFYPKRTLPLGQERFVTWHSEYGGQSQVGPIGRKDKDDLHEIFTFQNRDDAEQFRERTISILADQPHRGSGKLFQLFLSKWDGSIGSACEVSEGIVGGERLSGPVLVRDDEDLHVVAREFAVESAKELGRMEGEKTAKAWMEEGQPEAKVRKICDAAPVELPEVFAELGLKERVDQSRFNELELVYVVGWLEAFHSTVAALFQQQS